MDSISKHFKYKYIPKNIMKNIKIVIQENILKLLGRFSEKPKNSQKALGADSVKNHKIIRIPLSRKHSNKRNIYENYDFIHLKD